MTAPLEGLNPDYKLLAPEVEVIAKAIGGDKGKIDAVAASAGEWIKKDLSGANMNFLRNNSGLVGEIKGKIAGVVGTELSTSLASAKYDWQKSYMVVQAGLKALGYKGRGGAELRLNGIFSEDMFIALLTYQLSSENYKKKDYGTGEKGEGSGVINSRALKAMLEDLKTSGGAAKVTPAPVEVAKPAAVPAKEAPPVTSTIEPPIVPLGPTRISHDESGYMLVREKDEYVTTSNYYDKIERMPDGNFKCKKSGKRGLVSGDTLDNISPISYDDVIFLSQGKYKVRTGVQWLIIEVANSYEEVEQHGDLTFFKQNGRWGIMSEDGGVISEPKYDFLEMYSDASVIKFQQGGKGGVLSSDARTIILEAKYDEVYPSADYEGLFYVEQGGKWGVWSVARKGLLLDIKYEEVTLSGVKLAGKWGIWSPDTGTVVGEIKYDSIAYSLGSSKIVKLGGKYGLVSSSTGKELISAQYDDYKVSVRGRFDEVQVTKNGKCGLISLSTGKELIPAEYDSVSYSTRGVITSKGGKFGLYVENKMLLPAEFDEIVESSNGYRIRKNGKWGLVFGGTVVLKPEYDDIQVLGSGYRVQKGGKLGLMVKGQRVLPVEYDKIDQRWIQKDGKWGLLGKSLDRIQLEAKYDAAKIWDDGRVAVKLDGQRGLTYADSGQLMVPIKYEKLWPEGLGGIAYAETKGRLFKKNERGLLSQDGKSILLEAQYEDVKVKRDGRISFKKDGSWGLLSKDGKTVVVEAKYEDINVENDGRISIKLNGKWGLLSADGKTVIIEPIYSSIEVGRHAIWFGGASGNAGLLSLDGKRVLIEAEYDEIGTYPDGRVELKKGDKVVTKKVSF